MQRLTVHEMAILRDELQRSRDEPPGREEYTILAKWAEKARFLEELHRKATAGELVVGVTPEGKAFTFPNHEQAEEMQATVVEPDEGWLAPVNDLKRILKEDGVRMDLAGKLVIVWR